MINAIPQISSVNFTAHIPHVHKHHSHHYPITIINFHRVDDTLMRGAKPDYEQLKELKNIGVNNIISFCTNYNPKTKTQGSIPSEAQWAEKLQMNFHWLPFKSTENPSKSMVRDFFNIIDESKAKGEKVFIHCRHGADRTGLFSAIYRIKYQHAELSDVVKELMAYGHNANNNPNIIPYIIDFKESLKPVIKENRPLINKENMSPPAIKENLYPIKEESTPPVIKEIIPQAQQEHFSLLDRFINFIQKLSNRG